jgi:dTDP-4-amino-4,6-dideoxygalactose transaminase
MRSAIGRVQLSKLAANNARRAALDAYYIELLEREAPGIGLPYAATASGTVPGYHLRPILLPEAADRSRFMEAMKAQGIQTSIHYPPAHTFSYYAQAAPAEGLALTEAVGRREVTLPLYPRMTREQVETVVGAVRAALQESLESEPLSLAA